MNLNSKNNWLRRSAVSAILSAAAISQLPSQFQAYYWAPGVAFALLVVTAHSKKLELLAAVALSYSAGYASGDLLERFGTTPMRIGVVAIGSGLLALSLHWKGGLSEDRARNLALLGTALAIPFFWFTDRSGGGAPTLPLWIAAFSVWQMPVAWYYLKES